MEPRVAAHAYKQDAVESAPPIKIVRMLLQGALRFIDQASRVDPRDPRSPFVEHVSRVDAIVSELRLALDSDVDPQFCEGLEQLYLFVETRIQEALREREDAPLQDARQVIATLLEAWSSVDVGAEVDAGAGVGCDLGSA